MLRIVLVGCGVHAQRILIPALQIANARITAVCDLVEERRVQVAIRIGAKPYAELSELLDHEEFDAAVIATLPDTHSALLKQLIQAERPIFIEKPAGLSSQEITVSADLARKQGIQVQVGFMRRFAPAYRQIKQISRAWPISLAIQGRMACGPYSNDNGFLKDVAIHYIDLVRYLTGEIQDLTCFVVKGGNSNASAWQITLICQRGIASLLLSHRGTWGNPTGQNMLLIF